MKWMVFVYKNEETDAFLDECLAEENGLVKEVIKSEDLKPEPHREVRIIRFKGTFHDYLLMQCDKILGKRTAISWWFSKNRFISALEERS